MPDYTLRCRAVFDAATINELVARGIYRQKGSAVHMQAPGRLHHILVVEADTLADALAYARTAIEEAGGDSSDLRACVVPAVRLTQRIGQRPPGLATCR
jgi:hypothetical protein